MPVYKHKLTGQTAELSRDYAEQGFAAGTWKLVDKEGPNEARARELREALDNKVTVEEFEDEEGDH